MKVSVVIPAAGQGKRMKATKNKQFLLLNNKPILAHTISKFSEIDLIDEIIVVAKKEEITYCKKEVVSKYDFSKVKKIISGGKTRQESVYNGLKEVSLNSDFVLIHDGARPLIRKQTIEKMIRKVANFDAVAVGVFVKDTIKEINDSNFIVRTPKRENLIRIQTPQIFTRKLIITAYKKAFDDNFVGTDSSCLVERLGTNVKFVKGSYENIKITTPEDLNFAEDILSRRLL